MRILKTMMATCMFLGLATGAAFAGAGSGSAAAPAGGAGGGSAKMAPDKAAPAAGDKKPATAEMPMSKPPQEVADMAKGMGGGSWKCTGKVHMPGGDAAGADFTATVTGKLDLDKMWIHESLTQTKAKAPYKFEAYMTYDAAAKKWNRIMVDNMGGWEQTTSDVADASGVMTWTGSTGGMGMSAKSKTVHTKVSDKEFKLEGTMSMDSKTWNPSFEMDCKH